MTYTLIVGGELMENKPYHNFGENFENKELKKQFKMLQLGKENYCH